MTLSQLAEAERVQPPTITRVVDSLERKGLATRVPVRRRPAGRVRRADAGGSRARRDDPAPPRRVPRAPTPHLLGRRARAARARRGAARTAHRGSANHDPRPSPRSRDVLVAARTATTASTSSVRSSRSAAPGCSGSRRRGSSCSLTHNNGFALGVESGLQFLPDAPVRRVGRRDRRPLRQAPHPLPDADRRGRARARSRPHRRGRGRDGLARLPVLGPARLRERRSTTPPARRS